MLLGLFFTSHWVFLRPPVNKSTAKVASTCSTILFPPSHAPAGWSKMAPMKHFGLPCNPAWALSTLMNKSPDQCFYCRWSRSAEHAAEYREDWRPRVFFHLQTSSKAIKTAVRCRSCLFVKSMNEELSSSWNPAIVLIHSCICMKLLHIKGVVREQRRFENVFHLSTEILMKFDLILCSVSV